MSRTFLIIIILVFNVSVFAQQPINQSDQQGRKQGFWQKRSPEGKLLYEATFKDDKPIGEMKRFHPNGSIKATIIFTENSDTASAILYNENKQKIAEGKYVGQMKTGEWSYFSGGKLVSSETYQNNLKDGLAKKHYQSGELLEESNWKNNLQDGPYKAYYKNGEKYLECVYQNGLLDGWYVSFFDNGAMAMEAFYKNNLRHGNWKFYNEDGSTAYTLLYELGVLLTPEVLDSIQKTKFDELEKNKGKVLDPEKFMLDPEQYMIQNRMNK